MSTPTYTYPVTLQVFRRNNNGGGLVSTIVGGELLTVSILCAFHDEEGRVLRRGTKHYASLPSDLIDMLDFDTDGWLQGAKPSRAKDFFEWAASDLKDGTNLTSRARHIKNVMYENFGDGVSTTVGERCDSWSKNGDGNYFLRGYTLTSSEPLYLDGKPLTPRVQA